MCVCVCVCTCVGGAPDSGTSGGEAGETCGPPDSTPSTRLHHCWMLFCHGPQVRWYM